MSVEDRNNFACHFTQTKLDDADQSTITDFSDLPDLDKLQEVLTNLIEGKVAGFRGIVATAIVGMEIDATYDPINNFYGCNPRSIFEQGIVRAFRNRIPSGKSDPLNVAKNVNILDDGWIKGKRPEKSARAAVNYLIEITKSHGNRRRLLIELFYYRLVKYANSISSINIVVPKNEVISNQEFATICCKLINEYPESGTIPQFIVFKLLESLFENSDVKVEGGLESVFGTNTTSKKPADIWLEKDGKPINLFEITVKKVDYKRLNDCFDSLAAMNILHLPVQFICRLPIDVYGIRPLINGGKTSQGKIFEFSDIYEFVRSLCAILSLYQIEKIIVDIQLFMEEINRPVKTKEGWNTILTTLLKLEKS
jgi:hypothetical protein